MTKTYTTNTEVIRPDATSPDCGHEGATTSSKQGTCDSGRVRTLTTKDKLLEILGDFAADDLSVNGLLEVLEDKLTRQEERIKQLRSENAIERERLHSERISLHEEHKELRRNPATIISGPFYFYSPESNEKFMVQINRGSVETFKKKKKCQYVLQQISPAEYEAKV